MSFIRTGLREIGLKIRRQRTRMVLRHEKRLLQKSEIILGREGTSQAANFSELQALTPPAADLEAQTASISARRARLPEERAELVRARLGSSDAARIAKEKLVAAEEELSAIEKNIAKVRAEYEMRDRGFGDNIRAQQDAVRDAKQHHQVVEE